MFLKGLLFSMIASVLVILLTLVSFFISEDASLTREEVSGYECGFEHFSHSRLPFSFRYFLLTLIFLVFDMEIVFLLFMPETFYTNKASFVVLSGCLGFLVLLLMGLMYEWRDGSLDWVM